MAPDYSTLGYDELKKHRDILRDEVAARARHVASLAEDYAQAIRDREAAEMAIEAFNDEPDDGGPVVVETGTAQ